MYSEYVLDMEEFLSNLNMVSSGSTALQTASSTTSIGETEVAESTTVTSDCRKRARIQFTQHQITALETAFQKNQYTSRTDRIFMSDTLNLPESKIRIWFQNRRMKAKKQNTPNGQVSLPTAYSVNWNISSPLPSTPAPPPSTNENQTNIGYGSNASFSQNQWGQDQNSATMTVEALFSATPHCSPGNQQHVNQTVNEYVPNPLYDNTHQNYTETTEGNFFLSHNMAPKTLNSTPLPFLAQNPSNVYQINNQPTSNQVDWTQSENSATSFNCTTMPNLCNNVLTNEQNTHLEINFNNFQPIVNDQISSSTQVNPLNQWENFSFQ